MVLTSFRVSLNHTNACMLSFEDSSIAIPKADGSDGSDGMGCWEFSKIGKTGQSKAGSLRGSTTGNKSMATRATAQPKYSQTLAMFPKIGSKIAANSCQHGL